jgi:hypothetical protein
MKYLTINWREVNKAIEGGQLKELRKEEHEVKEKIQKKVDEFYKAKREADLQAKFKALKDAPEGTPIYYIGRSIEIPFGSEGKKVSQSRKNRTRMTVEFNGRPWYCAIINLQLDPLTESQKSSHNITTKLTNFLTQHPIN